MHVIGTAGHVDHGKSTLVEALTGLGVLANATAVNLSGTTVYQAPS